MANMGTRDLLVKQLEDVYALESHLVKVLSGHVKDAQGEPMIQQKIQQHLQETELHLDRIEQRLNALGTATPGLKTTISNIMGQLLGGMSGARTNVLGQNARDEYVSEHLEIISYIDLITLAQVEGDLDTVRTAQLNLRDEIAMQQWLIQHAPEATLKGLQKEGVQIPANALQSTQALFADIGVGTFGVQQPGYGMTPQPEYGMPQQPGFGTPQPGFGMPQQPPAQTITPETPPPIIP